MTKKENLITLIRYCHDSIYKWAEKVDNKEIKNLLSAVRTESENIYSSMLNLNEKSQKYKKLKNKLETIYIFICNVVLHLAEIVEDNKYDVAWKQFENIIKAN